MRIARSGIAHVPPLTYRVTRMRDQKLLPGSIALIVRMSGRVHGRHVTTTILATFQVKGDVLSGVYATDANPSAERRVGLRASNSSAKRLGAL